MNKNINIEEWLEINRTRCFEDQKIMEDVAPSPTLVLMQNVSGLTDIKDFAAHGCDLYLALNKASTVPLAEFDKVLDFGCGCGRLAHIFKIHNKELHGCDLNPRHIEWIQKNLPYMQAKVSDVHPPLPYDDKYFDAIISVSIFTHLNETSQDEFLRELYRITKPTGTLLLTVHGEMALNKACYDTQVRTMMCMEEAAFQLATNRFHDNKHGFILQQGHLTTDDNKGNELISSPFEYGISFISEQYIRKHWGQWFDVIEYYPGAIHEFQDIVVLRPKRHSAE